MKRLSILTLSLVLCSSQAADQPAHEEADLPSQPYAPGIEAPGYVWNALDGEEVLALRAKGDPARGQEAFIVCAGCHGSEALGDEAGYYPRLAGQYASVLIKQLADVREGRRDNPKMYPFANRHVVTTQELADIAVYLQGLPVPRSHGQGPETDLTAAAALYRKDCHGCHGDGGEGNGEKFYPRLNGQHYRYLLRQALDIRDGVRRNASPKMVEAIKHYSDEEVEQVIDYISRLPAQAAGKG